MTFAGAPPSSGALRERRPSLQLLDGVRDRARTIERRPSSLEAAAHRDAWTLAGLVAALCGFGLVMVLAASSVLSVAQRGTPWSIFERQVMWTAIGGVAYVLASRVNLTMLRRRSALLLVLAGGALFAVLVPHVGKGSGGASRWLGAGPFTVQPSELMKLAFLVFAADLVARREHAPDQLRAVVRPIALVLAVATVFIVKQPDLGSAIVVVCIALSVLYAGGISRRVLVSAGVVALTLGSVLALAAPYRRARLLSFINPFAHASGSGYQVVQSLLALGSGHLTGSGVGTSVAPWGLLPNAHTDFIFAVVGSDLGLAGSLSVLVAFGAFAWLGVRIAARATDRFSSHLATGITVWIVVQALINIGGVIGVLPETGIPLPFLSFGGSSLVVALLGCGLLQNVARHPARATASAKAVSTTRPATKRPATTRPATTRPPARVAPVRTVPPRAAARRPVDPLRAPRRAAMAPRPSTRAPATRRQPTSARAAPRAGTEWVPRDAHASSVSEGRVATRRGRSNSAASRRAGQLARPR